MAPAARSEPITACHVVAVPYPGRGHVNPMMNLCKLLASLKPDLLITVVLTEEWLGLIGAEEKPSGIRFATIPNVLPSERERAADMPSFVGATQTKMGEPFERLMARLEEPIHFIIADMFLFWAIDFGNRRNIPVASLWPMPASVFSLFYHLDLLERNGDHPFDVSERGEERIGYIEGIESIRLIDIPSIAYMKDQRLINLVRRIFHNLTKAQYVLISSIYELESQVMEALNKEFSFPIYTFGPAYLNLEKVTALSTNKSDDDQLYFDWLNSQPPSSVLYVSLGSFLSVSAEQMDEIADGLRASGVSFLWVARGEAKRLQQRCGEAAGRVVPWCDQLRVLCHPSIGGFWTHGGWNSTMECLFGGKPMICFPIILDQTTIRKHVVEDWKIGVDSKKDLAPGDILRSGKITEIVKKFMDADSSERREMVGRAREFREVIRQAVSEGGSSLTNLATLLDHIQLAASDS